MERAPIRVAEPVLDGNERAYVLDCLDSTWISSRGKYIEQFEAQLSRHCGVQYAVAVNNGTTALHLALAGLGVKPGDEVIVPTLTYIATANAVRYCGATPVLVDSLPGSMAIDPARIAERITPRTRGVITVPLYGHPVDADAVSAVAKAHGLFVLEDAAEALGARFRGRPVGSLADVTSFSFFGNKIITTGEGGMLVTANPELAARLRFLRGQAVSPEKNYWHTDVGFNYRMTNIAAAIGCAQMERIDEHLARRQQVARWYFERLSSQRHRLILPDAEPECHHCYWMFSVVMRDGNVDVRDRVMRIMAEDAIETRPLFYPVHWMPPYWEPAGRYPVAERMSSRGISLPTHGRLSESDIDRVCERLVAALGQVEATLRGQRQAA